MEGNHPKRRKDKYNPYVICEKDGRYYISFKDGQAILHTRRVFPLCGEWVCTLTISYPFTKHIPVAVVMSVSRINGTP